MKISLGISILFFCATFLPNSYIENIVKWNEEQVINAVEELFVNKNRQIKEFDSIKKWVSEDCHKIQYVNYKKFCLYFLLKLKADRKALLKYEYNNNVVKFIFNLLYKNKIRFSKINKSYLTFIVNSNQDFQRLKIMRALSKINTKWSFLLFSQIKEIHTALSRNKEKLVENFTILSPQDMKIIYNTLPKQYRKYVLINLYHFYEKTYKCKYRCPEKNKIITKLKKLVLFFLKKSTVQSNIIKNTWSNFNETDMSGKRFDLENYYIAWQIAIKILDKKELSRYMTDDILKDRWILAYIINYKRFDLISENLKFTVQKPSQFLSAALCRQCRMSSTVLGKRTVKNNTVLKSLLWLWASQEKDGKWIASKFNPYHGNFGLPYFVGYEDFWYDISITGLSILSFASAGFDHLSNNVLGEALNIAKEWLVKNQNKNGLIDIQETPVQILQGQYKEPVSRNKHGSLPVASIYNHNISLYALTEMYLLSQDKELLPKITNAYNYSKNFKYTVVKIPKALNLDDIGPSIFTAIAYVLINKSKIINDKTAIQYIKKYINMIEEKGTGQVSTYSPVPKCLGGYDSAASLLSIKGFLGIKKEKSKSIRAGLKYLYHHLPKWKAFYRIPKVTAKSVAESFFNDDDIVNEFYWLFGSIAFKFYNNEHFLIWYRRLTKILKTHQRNFGIYMGSFDPEGPWSKVGGRIYMTSMATLSLQSPILFNYKIFRRNP